jgi:hypothetical protein
MLFKRWWILSLLLLAGCGLFGGQNAPPSVDPDSTADRAMASYDTNKDGILDEQELDRVPSLKFFAKKSGKSSLEKDDIAERIRLYQSGNVGYMSVPFRILLDDAPLAGAQVTLIPEEFLGSRFKQATGTTNENGVVTVQAIGGPDRAVPVGFYRIEIRKAQESGPEMIPERYNSQSILGIEIGPAKYTEADTVFKLTKH